MTPHVALTHPIPHYISHIQDVPRESSVCSRIGSKPSLVDSPNSNVARVVCLVLERFEVIMGCIWGLDNIDHLQLIQHLPNRSNLVGTP